MKNLLSLLSLLIGSTAFAQVVTTTESEFETNEMQTMENDSLMESKWTYGLMLGYGARHFSVIREVSETNPDLFETEQDSPVFYLGGTISYEISEQSQLRLEILADFYRSITPQANLQYGYFLNERFELYGGAGVVYDDSGDNDDFGNNEIAVRREIIPHALAGFRYYATADFYVDGRFNIDLINPTEEDDQLGSVSRNSTFYLGIGFRF